MTSRLRTFLLLFITLALAFAPLRGALALPASSATDSDSHCAEMMHGMTTSDSITTQQQTATRDNNTEDCCHQYDSSCADSNCTDCVHTTIGIANSIFINPDSHNTAPPSQLLVSFPHGNFSPPYRPPVSI